MNNTTYRQIAVKYASILTDDALIDSARRSRDHSARYRADRAFYRAHGCGRLERFAFTQAMDAAKAARVYLREYDRRRAVVVDIAAEMARARQICATPSPDCPGCHGPALAYLHSEYEPDQMCSYRVESFGDPELDEIFDLP